jgi:hypothetical protein
VNRPRQNQFSEWNLSNENLTLRDTEKLVKMERYRLDAFVLAPFQQFKHFRSGTRSQPGVYPKQHPAVLQAERISCRLILFSWSFSTS